MVRASGSAAGRFDRLRLDQVITNLVANAIKYGAGKPIEIDVGLYGDRVRISTRDHGIGVPAEARDRIFGRFERAASERHYGGLGLGLWITREIVQAHGGTIAVDSAPGEGSVFTVELPWSPPTPERASPKATEASPPKP